MKKYATRSIRLIALCYMSFPISFPLFLSIWLKIPGTRVISLFLSPLYWLGVILAVVSGYGIWEMRRWAWYVFLGTNLLLVYETAFVSATFGEGQHSALGFLLIVSLIFASTLRAGNELRVPYYLPNIRWWESDPSRKLSVPVKIVKEGHTLEGDILDLGFGGCFIKSPDDFNDDEALTIRFSIFGHEVHAKGNVVWRAVSAVTHPKGVGFKFSAVEKGHRRRLKIAAQRIRKMSLFTPAALASPLTAEKVKHAKA